MTTQQQRRAAWTKAFNTAKQTVRERSRGQCEWPDCDRAGAHYHHKARRLHPAANEAHNIAHLCEHHHAHIHAHPEESYAEGWLIRWDDVPPAANEPEFVDRFEAWCTDRGLDPVATAAEFNLSLERLTPDDAV